MKGPLFYFRVRLAVRDELRERGLSRSEANVKVSSLTRDDINSGVELTADAEAMSRIGDGKILARIVAFLKSDAGKALIRVLLSILVAI
jgi:hypothetical protein